MVKKINEIINPTQKNVLKSANLNTLRPMSSKVS